MRRIPVVLLAAALALAAAPAAAAGPKVGLSLPTQREERWVRDRQAMEEAAKKAGVELHVVVADNDARKQAAQCEALIAQKVEVLILAPHDAASAGWIVERAARAGIPVISYERLVTGSPHDYHYLSFDNTRVGELQGEFLARKVPRGRYVLLSGSANDHNARLFADGALKHLQPLVESGAVEVVLREAVKDWQPHEARRLCAQALEAGAVDAVLAPNDGTAGGCIEALAAKGLAGQVPITGQDAEAAAAVRIVQGLQSMTVFKDTRELGRKAIEMAVALADGDTVDTRGRTIHNGVRAVPAVLLTPRVVTPLNLERVLVESGYLRRADVYLR
jgi:D-xylose transport system substrate-binding protein